jgi:pyruvate dehydrogenase E2 component (dihydrolipoamide acetyltransferase)
MPIAILMPALSPTMTEGTLAKWLKKAGDSVKSGEVMAEIETDKATMEVEAVDEGVIGQILVDAGTGGVKVNAPIAVLLEEGESQDALAPFVQSLMNESGVQPGLASEVQPLVSSPGGCSPVVGSRNPAEALSHVISGARVFASPLAKRIAEQKGISLASVKGTGPRGRIIKADIETWTPSAAAGASAVCASEGGFPTYKAVPVSGMRKIIAERLSVSKQTIPHFYLTIELEMDALLQVREQINRSQDKVKVSVNDMLIKALALALRQVPEANAAWAGHELRYYESADVSVAVAIEGGLVTPVLRQADARSLLDVSYEMKRLAEAARAGKLKPEDWQGGTITLSNLGMFGIDQFEAIINPPQACILAVGACVKKPVVKDDQIKIASLMKATLSADHRVVDGAVGANFLSAFKDIIHKPLRMLLG